MNTRPPRRARCLPARSSRRSELVLWISEWGYVQCEDLRRSEEILTGTLPTAKDGMIVVETTWRGGRGGHLWDIVKKALETPEEQKQPDE